LKRQYALFLSLFISADATYQRKRKKERKVLLPAGVSKSAAHTVLFGKLLPVSEEYMQE
jgi:hypothetical protein